MKLPREIKTMQQSKLLTPSEVARLFKVDPKTVTRWSQNGKLKCIKTVGGHRRYDLAEVQKLLNVLEPAS